MITVPRTEIINPEAPVFSPRDHSQDHAIPHRDHANQSAAKHSVNQSKQPQIHGLNRTACFRSQLKKALLQVFSVYIGKMLERWQQTEVLAKLDCTLMSTGKASELELV